MTLQPPKVSTYESDRYERDMRLGAGNTLHVILKVAERCNIACKYCYFFFGGDESYKDNPAYISEATILEFAKFIEDGVDAYNLDLVRVIIHGGEPLMLKKQRMEFLFQSLAGVAKKTKLQYTIQTNAMLVDDEWIELFAKYEVYVGISMDGPKEFNDIDRIDKRHRGTYDRTIAGTRKLFEASSAGKIARPGLLCVVNPSYPPKRLYEHFVNELGFHNIDFLLPDDNHDGEGLADKSAFAKYMVELFQMYKAETNGEVRIRFFEKIMKSLTMRPFFSSVLHRFYTQKEIVFTVSSKGDIAPDDILRTTDPELMKLDLNVGTHTLRDLLVNPVMTKLYDAAFALPQGCHGCDWANVCKGGDLYHRYSADSGFANPSIYCESLKAIHTEVTELLIRCNVESADLEARLGADSRNFV